ncbi:hypothetical protein Sjap_016869 [Stephania japonica]|uniref:Splicing factor U2af large subunit n=1 Tax=Stephania japonica TaxID=461633 RepID=A0AAP0I531_9MAGN
MSDHEGKFEAHDATTTTITATNNNDDNDKEAKHINNNDFNTSASPPTNPTKHSSSDGQIDSKSQNGLRDDGREFSERDREKKREREQEREMREDRAPERIYDHNGYNDHRRRWNDRRECGRSGDGDDDAGRQLWDSERERDGWKRHKSQSRSRVGSDQMSTFHPFSESKSKSTSGFYSYPTSSTLDDGGAATAITPGQFLGTNQSRPGIFQDMLPTTSGKILSDSVVRHALRVYVGGLPPTANEQSVTAFFSRAMSSVGGNTFGPGDAVVYVYMNHEKNFGFVEMRSVEEASNAMALNGIIFEGTPLRVRRPSDYCPTIAVRLGPSQPNPNLNLSAVGITPGSSGRFEGPDRIFVGGLPHQVTEPQLRELLEYFGPLRDLDLIKDRETGRCRGYAFCVYQDRTATDVACAALNGITMGDKVITVRRKIQGQPKPEQETVSVQAHHQRLLSHRGARAQTTKILCLKQAVSADELRVDDEYEDIVEDMREEGSKFGKLVNVVIPRPSPIGEPSPGVGKVFLEYADAGGAENALAKMNGRLFGGLQIAAVLYPENMFSQGVYTG